MQFSETTNRSGIIQACEDYCNLGATGISGNTGRLQSFTRWVNDGGREIWSVIVRSAHNWIYDDSNQTDLPQAATDLEDGVGKYSIPNGALRIRRIEIKDENDVWTVITPYALENLPEAVDEFYSENGIPTYWRVVGTTIELKPAPNYDKTGGLKVYFDRECVSFVTTDTTAVPGFASTFHDALAKYASIQWLRIKEPQSGTLAKLEAEWEVLIRRGTNKVQPGKIEEHYTNNLPAKTNVISRRHESFV
jgi:hypothetical protein